MGRCGESERHTDLPYQKNCRKVVSTGAKILDNCPLIYNNKSETSFLLVISSLFPLQKFLCYVKTKALFQNVSKKYTFSLA